MPTESSQAGSDDLALLGLLQLVSPALPIGAFAWSQGLESAFDLGWVSDEVTLGAGGPEGEGLGCFRLIY